MTDQEKELTKQADLVKAIFGQTQHPSYDQAGLEAYQRGLKANATRALEVTFSTIAQLLGTESFASEASAYLQTHAPSEGDWGIWGESFPEELEKNSNLNNYPYLRDCAKLDWLIHIAQREKDNHFNPDSLALLEQDPYSIGFIPGMGLSLVKSHFPIVDIYQAHQTDGDSREEWLSQARQKLQSSEKQTAVIWRKEWKALVQSVDDAEALWMSCLLAKQSLGESLDKIKETPFSLETWLPKAIEKGWILGVYSKTC